MLSFIIRIFFVVYLLPFSVSANTLTFNLSDNKNKPLNNAVVSAISLDPVKSALKAKKATITQRNKTFSPYLSVFPKGTVATFLNQDTVKHHVYSFSTPKKFEIKLFSGKPAKTITFDQPGKVTFGCNIHDDMLAYAFIVDTPYYATSNKIGKVVLKDLPNGKYLLRVQHPLQKKGMKVEQKISLPNKVKNFSYKLALKPQWKKRKKKKTNKVIYDETEVN